MHEHRLSRIVRTIVFIGAWSVIAIPVIAQTPPDNTGVNTRDRAPGAITADQQKENASDRAITRKIRQSLMKDKALSSYAHNVKVIAQSGQVTLKGPVRSDDEKQTVEAKAIEVAGVGHVTNEISIVPAHSKNATK
jgi:hyperosmotically inducible protein